MVEVIDRRLLCVDVDGFAWIKRGSAIAYQGELRFRLEQVLQAEAIGLKAGPLRNAVMREAVPLAKAEGRGRLYLSNDGKFSTIFRLNAESLYVTSSNLLAFESTLEHEIRMLGGVGLLAGGILVVRLSGTGWVAVSSYGNPLTLRVTEDEPVSTDPTATLAWTSGLWPELKTDLEIASFLAHGGGEPIQMYFGGNGSVTVHARSRTEAVRASLLRQLTSWATKLFV
jgi:uncharacterized protein (AIM24 family)